MGGVAAFWGAKFRAPRIGKFDKDGTPRPIPAPPLPMAILGTFILLVGWMGFNGGSTFARTDLRLTVGITHTIISSAFGCLAAMCVMWRGVREAPPRLDSHRAVAGAGSPTPAPVLRGPPAA